MNTTIQVRIDSKTKRDAQKVFKEMGLDLSSGVKMYLNEVLRTQSLPFTPRTANGFTEDQEQTILGQVAQAKKTGKRYTQARVLHDDILKAA